MRKEKIFKIIGKTTKISPSSPTMGSIFQMSVTCFDCGTKRYVVNKSDNTICQVCGGNSTTINRLISSIAPWHKFVDLKNAIIINKKNPILIPLMKNVFPIEWEDLSVPTRRDPIIEYCNPRMFHVSIFWVRDHRGREFKCENILRRLPK